jgi:hypothetical protein
MTADDEPDLIPPTDEVRRHLARSATETNRLRRLLRLAVRRDREVERRQAREREGVGHGAA